MTTPSQSLLVLAGNIFNELDANKDGKLTPLELSTKLSDFGFSDEKIFDFFMDLDLNMDGYIDQQEFEKGFEKWREASKAAGCPIDTPREPAAAAAEEAAPAAEEAAPAVEEAAAPAAEEAAPAA